MATSPKSRNATYIRKQLCFDLAYQTCFTRITHTKSVLQMNSSELRQRKRSCRAAEMDHYPNHDANLTRKRQLRYESIQSPYYQHLILLKVMIDANNLIKPEAFQYWVNQPTSQKKSLYSIHFVNCCFIEQPYFKNFMQIIDR